VVENGGLGRACCRPVVVTRDGVQQLGEDGGIEIARALFDHPESQVDVPEQAALLGGPEAWPAPELPDAADVVEQGCGQEKVGPKARVQLRRLPAERRHAHGVLEQAARVAVMPVGTRCGERAERRANVRVANERADDDGQPRVGDLVGEELEESVELVGIAPERRRQRGGVDVLHRLDRVYLHLKLSPEALDATQYLHGVALREARVEQVDVAPDPRVDPSARIRELEREVRSPRPSVPALLSGDREDALDRPVLDELGDRGHGASLGFRGVGTLVPMADAQPFRAVRYSGAAGPLGELVAPPYDAVDDEERARLFTRSPYNVVHVTLPESIEDAGRLYAEWLAGGILEQERDPATWLVVESYVGPDGVARERHGLACSIAAEPYATRHVLPHERTHPAIRQDRLRLLRATRVQPEPIFVLADSELELAAPDAPPDLQVDGTRLWRMPATAVRPLDDVQLLIADGHHRYESAVEFGKELRAAARIMALVVPAHDPGLHVFPTHRIFASRPDLAALHEGEPYDGLEDALAALGAEPFERAAAVAYRAGRVELVRGAETELDVELVDRHGLAGIGYTPRIEEAVATVDRGQADVAFLLREPRVEDVFAVARRGERMPQKSTYFYPKPLSGLLFHSVDG